MPCIALAMSVVACAPAAWPCCAAALPMLSAAFLMSSAAFSACFCCSDFPHAAVHNAAITIALNICRIVTPSPSDGESILAQIRSAEQDTVFVIDPDRLVAAHRAAALDNGVAARLERAPDLRADAAFDGELLADVPDARRIARLLHVHAEVDDVGDDLRVSLRLVVAAHHAEGHHGSAVLRKHRGNQRMQGPFVRADLMRMPRLQRESRAAVLQRDAGVAGHEARAKAVEE